MERVEQKTFQLWILFILAAGLFNPLWPDNGTVKRIRSFVHPRAVISGYPECFRADFEKRGVLSAEEAIAKAVKIMHKKGIRGLCICEVTWIAGGISGYLVDALGDLRVGGVRYSTFRLGVTDSS